MHKVPVCYAPLLHLKRLPQKPMPPPSLEQLFALAREDHRQIRRRRLADEKARRKDRET